MAATIAVSTALATIPSTHLLHMARSSTTPAFTQRDGCDAKRQIDIPRIESLLNAGWKSNTPFDRDRSGTLAISLDMREWDPAHDKHKLPLVAKTFLEAGARLDPHNA